jgi:hypothetical protein
VFVRSAVGVVALVVAFGPLILGTRSLRRRMLPGWDGPPGWLVQIVIGLAVCLVTVLGLGVVHIFSLVPTTLVLASFGIAMLAAGSRLPTRVIETPEREPDRLGRAGRVVAVVATAVFAATWGARVYVALSHGMVSIDSLWYHLPQAARFAHEHSVTGIHHDVVDLSGFYPINAELMHSLGMVVLGTDSISMVLTTMWGAVALLAAWCIGRPHGLASASLTGVAVLLCAPGIVGTQPGAAHNDIVGITLLLVSAALLVTAGPTRVTRDPLVIALAAVPIGFAVGAKWTFVPVAVAITIGVVVLLPRGRRLRLSAVWLAVVGALGSFSYVRNLVKAGSPLPNTDVKIGPIGWDRKVAELDGTGSLTRFLLDTSAWQNWFAPGLSQFFGLAWWGPVAAVVAGLLLAVVSGPGSVTRMLGWVGIAALVGYIVQPQVLLVYDQPALFYTNIRYGTIAMAFGLVLLPISPVFRSRRLVWLPPVGFLALIGIMQLDPTVWPTELRELRWENPVRGADAVSGVVFGVLALGAGLVIVFWGDRIRSWVAPRRVAVALGAVAVFGIGGLSVQQWYLSQRYSRPETATPFLEEHWQSWKWARDVHGARIGVNGPALSYPLFGNRLTNMVDALPASEVPASDERARCAELRRTVNKQRLDYVALFAGPAPVVGTTPQRPFEQSTPQVEWLASDPSATQVLEAPFEAIFRIDGPLDPAGCR